MNRSLQTKYYRLHRVRNPTICCKNLFWAVIPLLLPDHEEIPLNIHISFGWHLKMDRAIFSNISISISRRALCYHPAVYSPQWLFGPSAEIFILLKNQPIMPPKRGCKRLSLPLTCFSPHLLLITVHWHQCFHAKQPFAVCQNWSVFVGPSLIG